MQNSICIPVRPISPEPNASLTPELVKMFFLANPDANILTDIEKKNLSQLVSNSGSIYSKYEVDQLLLNSGGTNTGINVGTPIDEIGGIEWVGGKVYDVGTVVIYNNVAYKCIFAHTSVSWASNMYNWEFIISDPGKF